MGNLLRFPLYSHRDTVYTTKTVHSVQCLWFRIAKFYVYNLKLDRGISKTN